MAHATAVDVDVAGLHQPGPGPARTPRAERAQALADRPALRPPLRRGLPRLPGRPAAVRVLPEPLQQGPGHGRRLRRAEELHDRVHRPAVPQGRVVRRAVRAGAHPGADVRLARAGAGAGRPDHPLRPLRPADDLPAVRDPRRDRRPHVGLPLQPHLRPDAADRRPLRRAGPVPARPRPRVRRADERRHLAVGRLLHDHHLRRPARHRLLDLRGRPHRRGERRGRSPSASRCR